VNALLVPEELVQTPPYPNAASPATVQEVEVLAWEELGEQHRVRWQNLRQTQREQSSPFFSCPFIDAVQAARGDVLVAVLRDHRQAVGYLPFHRIGSVALPVGRYFNDAHGVIMHPKTQVDWPWLLRQCELKAFDFHAWAGACETLDPGCLHGTIESFSTQIGIDSAQPLASIEREHKTMRKQDQKSRKMARERGPLSVEIDCRDVGLVEQTIQWKRDQYRRTCILDLFTPTWTRDLMHHLHQAPVDGARGMLSVLRAGEQVVAAHYGLFEDGQLHYWFPTYDPHYARYSPGTALFKEILRAGPACGITSIDMGYGAQPYKRKQTNTITTVAHGCITTSPVYHHRRKLSKLVRQAIKKMPVKNRLKQVFRCLLPQAGISKLD